MTADKDKPELTEEELNARHAEKMRKKKAARDKIMATKTIEKGLLIVHTGKAHVRGSCLMARNAPWAVAMTWPELSRSSALA